MSKSIEERVTEIEQTLEQIKKIFLLQMEKTKIDHEVHTSLMACVTEVAKQLGVDISNETTKQ